MYHRRLGRFLVRFLVDDGSVTAREVVRSDQARSIEERRGLDELRNHGPGSLVARHSICKDRGIEYASQRVRSVELFRSRQWTTKHPIAGTMQSPRRRRTWCSNPIQQCNGPWSNVIRRKPASHHTYLHT